MGERRKNLTKRTQRKHTEGTEEERSTGRSACATQNGMVRFKVGLKREGLIEQEQTIVDGDSPWGAWRIWNEHDGVPVRGRHPGGGCGNDVPGVAVAGRGPGDSGHHVFEAKSAPRAGDCADARA